MIAKLRRRDTSAAVLLDGFVSMVNLHLF